MTASSLDIFSSGQITDLTRIMYVMSVLFSLVKCLFLIRVFRMFSYLVMMLIQVFKDVRTFLVLFLIFILTFAECYRLLDIDTSSYGRVQPLIACFLSVLRSSFGDFSIIDPKMTFDLFTFVDGEKVYSNTETIIYFTFLIYTVSVFCLFMIFMNFIIAVIGNSFKEVQSKADAYDYKQRADLIYEKEIHFKPKDFDNEIYFPNILIVR
jgi:hypothetical protein